MRIHRFSLFTALLFTVSLVSAKNLFSGLQASGHLVYISSDLESTATETNGITDTYENRNAASGLGQGAGIGYRVGMNNRFTVGASISGFTSQAEQKESGTSAGLANRSQTLKLNHAIYPFLEGGFSPSDETLIIAKAGYGKENWDISLQTSNTAPTVTSSSDIKGLIAGAEIATLIRDKVFVSIAINYSDLETVDLSATDGGGDTVNLSLSPKTLSASVSVGYLPSGIIF